MWLISFILAPINFPIFNVADIYVTVAAFMFIILGLFYYKEEDFSLIFPTKSMMESMKISAVCAF